MNNLFVGDLHGCLNTFVELLDKYWNGEDCIVQVGDLCDRGNFTYELVKYSMKLKEKFPSKFVFLMGNHEHEILLHRKNGFNLNWYSQCGAKTLEEYSGHMSAFEKHCKWFKTLPLVWENDFIVASHAGYSIYSDENTKIGDRESILWTRNSLQNKGKIQIVGHTPQKAGNPTFNKESKAWYIDTGVFKGLCLTALKLDDAGNLIEIIQIPTNKKDIE